MNHLPIPRAQSTTDMLDEAAHEQKVMEFFNRLVKAWMTGNGSYLKILKEMMMYGKERAQQPARERIEQRRREKDVK